MVGEEYEIVATVNASSIQFTKDQKICKKAQNRKNYMKLVMLQKAREYFIKKMEN